CRRTTWRTRPSLPRALACPASLKGVLAAPAAAAALASGFRRAGVTAVELPLADGGQGALEAIPAGRLCERGARDGFGPPGAARGTGGRGEFGWPPSGRWSRPGR